MHAVPIPTERSVFLDTTELYSTAAYVKPPVFFEPTLSQISYYVSRLTVEELAVQLHQEFSKAVKPAMGQYSMFFSRTDVQPNLDHFRESIIENLLRVSGLTIFDEVSHGADEQRLLFSARHKGAYKDAIIYASAVAYAKANSLPWCCFITQDNKGGTFPELNRTLSSIHPMSLMSRGEFEKMVNLDATLYTGILARLKPKLVDLVRLRREELVKRALSHPESLGPASPEAIDFVASLSEADSDLSSIVEEVRNIVVGANSDSRRSLPNNVTCRMIVRYSVPNLWARLYWANASAALSYSAQGDLTDTEITNFNLDWAPIG